MTAPPPTPPPTPAPAERPQPTRRDRLHLRAMLAALGVAALVALVVRGAAAGSPVTSSRLPLVQITTRLSEPPPILRGSGLLNHLPPSATAALIVFLVVGFVVPVLYGLVRFALLLLGVRHLSDLKGARWREEEADMAEGERLDPVEVRRRLLAGIDEGLDRLAGAADVRSAVVACWVVLESAAADVGVEARPEETATDLAVRVLAERHVPRAPLDRLLVLYHEARYSPHELTAADGAAARAALGEVRDGLGAADRVPR